MSSKEPIAQLRSGKVRGSQAGGVVVFRGVPYAEPPVGPLRFRPAVECTPWEGVREADAVGSIAHQWPTPLETMQGRMDLPQSEDCLTLNVWTPALDEARRPVMVWIHGGAYLNGTGAAEWFDGTSFATQHDVVVVTINYRLNVFGYLHLGGLDASEEGSGNCGLLDQVAALRWVRDNIASFGGDPENVTIFGESAGAMSVGVLLATPSAAGLYHRAILQSGASANVAEEGEATAFATTLLEELGLSPDAKGIAALRELPAEQIMVAWGTVAAKTPPDMAAPHIVPLFAPVVDGVTLPQQPLDAIRQGSSSTVPVIVGTNKDEMEVMRINGDGWYDFGDEEVQRRFGTLFGALADEARAFYSGPGKGEFLNVWTAVDSDRLFTAPAIELAEARFAAGGVTWLYLFTWPTPAFDGQLRAAHTVEIPFVFNNFELGASPALLERADAAATDLSERIHRTWAEFARHGNPTNESIPSWPPYEPQERATMVFDIECAVVNDAQRDRREFWQRVAAENDSASTTS